MTEEEKDLLLKDLSTRLPYDIICHANEINLDGKLLFINKIYNIVAIYNDNATGKFDTCPITDVKPYLRPMSSMTEEERKDFYENLRPKYDGKPWESIGADVDWLNAHHFDYRGLIEKGLAIEAPKDMYN